MENNDIQPPVTPVASSSLDHVEHDAQLIGVSSKPDVAPSQAGGDADTKETKEGSAQPDASAEALSVSPDAASAKAKSAASSTTVTTQSYVPPVKRFSAVNINKKFLLKNQSSTASGGSTTSSSSANKQTGTIARPAPQSAHSHSRLVTAKLTATPVSSSPGQGWSRPNSVTPPAPSPANASTPSKGPTPTIAPVGGHGPPHIAPGGKIIQPQVLKQKLDGPGRPAWRTVQPGAVSSGFQTAVDFPTAAEAAQSRLLKLADAKAVAHASDAQKQIMSETADAFRGVHLDPNAHHWDEMEDENNDDYLGDVIEFGDGRQYTIQVTDGTKGDPNAPESSSGNIDSEVPVSKAERFVDDFDRSWPKSRHEDGSHGHGSVKDEAIHPGRDSHSEVSSNHSGHSPVSMRDSSYSKVLFNDRLNRMEPIPSGRPGTGSHMSSHGAPFHRDGPPDGQGRFHNRIERDAPPHSSFTNTRKPYGHDRPVRQMRSDSTASHYRGDDHDRKGRSDWNPTTAYGGPHPNGRQFGSREPSVAGSIINGAPSIASSDDHSSRYAPSIRDHHRSQVPHSERPGDMERQLPPHLGQSRPAIPYERPAIDADSHAGKLQALADVPSRPTVAKEQPPSLTHTVHPTQAHSDAGLSKPPSSVPPGDVEALRKAYLAESAERAKRRRQQEEEERLKAQERARKKAAELEAKIVAAKAAEAPKDTAESTAKPVVDVSPVDKSKPTEAEVLHVIEEAINSAVSPELASKSRSGEPRSKETSPPNPTFERTPSTSRKESDLPVTGEIQAAQSKRPSAPPISDRVDSWRTKSKPPTISVVGSKDDVSNEPAASFIPAVGTFELQADESMEVVDFSDISRLVGEKVVQQTAPSAEPPTSKPSRPVASDFFRGSGAEKSEQDSWRRPSVVPQRSYFGVEHGHGHAPSREPSTNDSKSVPPTNDIPAGHREDSQGSVKASPQPTNGVMHSHLPNHSGYAPSSPGVPKFARSPNASYREAPLSALDDTMSRIKGALDVMHSVAEHGGKADMKDAGSASVSRVHLPVPVSEPAKPTKWLPPALRPPGTETNRNRSATFEPTRPEPPRSPAPPDNRFTIRLPSVSRRIEPLTKKQISYQKYYGPVRWEILSFDPPVEGMTKKSLLVNDVLFRKPQGTYKSRKYRVLLPKSNAVRRMVPDVGSKRVVSDTMTTASLSKGTTSTAIGQLSSHRSSSASARAEGISDPGKAGLPILDVTSRSPPPELAPRTERTPAVSAGKQKSSQKSLEVNDVAFYRDVRKTTDINGSVPAVNFIVGSELEGPREPPKSLAPSTEGNKTSQNTTSEPMIPEARVSSSESATVLTGVLELHSSSAVDSSRRASEEKISEQQSDHFLRRPPVTPSPQKSPSTWGKSPARAPDPEHLKAVWSQPSNNDSLPTVNSLKSIADDLTAVPFTLQEVKSEGGTPPPALPGPVAPPTRMSASEVTRAFQTVPSGPSNAMPSTTLRSNQMPSSVGSPIGSQRASKPPPIGMPPPSTVNHNGPRPPYMGYPAPMSNHTPSPPTLVYSHVMPNGMPGSPQAAPYGQPMWMPVVQQGPQMVRAASSAPYSPSLMPYAMPSSQNGMYPPTNGMPNPQSSPATYPSTHPPSQIVVSPVLHHASPAPHMVYPGSPMVMHVPPPGGASQPRAYPPSAVGMSRGSMPVQVQNPMDPRTHPPPAPSAAPASRFPVHNPGYTPVPAQPYVRPW